jgi:hypothetical protein
MKIAFTPPDSDAAADWALSYARAGLAVFPVRADKKPLTIRGFKDAVIDEVQIRAWWTSYPHADIGWAVPAEIVVVDLDVGAGADGLRDFFECIGANPDDVETPQATTPRGGRHLVFDACGQTYKNGVRLNGAAIDTRSSGGYIVLPGPGNGRVWRTPLATPLAEAPDGFIRRRRPSPFRLSRRTHSPARRSTPGRRSSVHARRSGLRPMASRKQRSTARATASAAWSAAAILITKPQQRRFWRPLKPCRPIGSHGRASRQGSAVRSPAALVSRGRHTGPKCGPGARRLDLVRR